MCTKPPRPEDFLSPNTAYTYMLYLGLTDIIKKLQMICDILEREKPWIEKDSKNLFQ